MIKHGIESKRRQQLIDATLESLDELGMQGTTVQTISQRAGLSVGIVGHYFGGKQALLEACLRYLLKGQTLTLLHHQQRSYSPTARLAAVLDVYLAPARQLAWPARIRFDFWAQAMYEPEIARLQRIYQRRMLSHLQHALHQLLPAQQAEPLARQLQLLIEGGLQQAALQANTYLPGMTLQLCWQLLALHGITFAAQAQQYATEDQSTGEQQRKRGLFA
jgi:TetR/AcrR family transcriptional regulator, transcriptional repressor of bet genes